MRFSLACLATCCVFAPALATHAGTALETPAAPASGAPWLGPGETFGFQVSWGIFPRAGSIDIAADPLNPDVSAERRVTVRIATDGTFGRLYRYEAIGETLFAADTGLMQRASYRARIGKKKQQRDLTFDYVARVAHYRDTIDPTRDATLTLPEGEPVDLITSLVTARRWQLAPGDTREILVQVDDDFYPLLLRAGAIERLRTKRGEFSALVITPESAGKARGLFRRGGSLKIWIEDSPARLPLRIEAKGRFGTVTADLVHYTPPLAEPEAIPTTTPTPSPSVACAAATTGPSI